MRFLGRLLFVVLLATGFWVSIRLGSGIDISHLISRDRADWKLEYASQATISAAYAPMGNEWLEFVVPPNAQQIKIVANAVLASIEQARWAVARDPQRRWPFSLTIELCDSNGQSLLVREHHFRTNFNEWRDNAGRRITDLYFLTDSSVPTRGTVLHINLSGLPEVARLRIRLATADPMLTEVLIRAYFPEIVNESRLAYLWQRLNERQKIQLAKGSVYPPELLLEIEKQNLMRNGWNPAGPMGSRGIDFAMRELYALRDVDGTPVDDPVPPAGLPVGPDRHAILHLPEGGGHYRIEFAAISTIMPAPTSPEPLHLRWFGITPFECRNFRLDRDQGQTRWAVNLPGGTVEISSPIAGTIRLYNESDGRELTPPLSYRRLYLVDSRLPLDFALAHSADQATPLKLETRWLHDPAELQRTPPAAPPTLTFIFFDAADRPLAKGRLPTPAPLSIYDAPVGELSDTRVSDPGEIYFVAPPGAVRLRLLREDGDNGILLAGLSSRPADLPRRLQLPEDHYDAEADERIPAWFPLRPSDHERRVLENRTRLLTVQIRPPEDRPDLLAGNFQWQDYRPVGPWRSVPILAPRDTDMPARDEALVSTYRMLPANRELTVDFPAAFGLTTATPHLLWLSEQDQSPFRIALHLDGHRLPTPAARGRQGQIDLPPIAVGRHRLRIDAPLGLRLYLSHAHPNATTLIRRNALTFDGPMEFVYQRSAAARNLDEFLSLRLFQPPSIARGELRIDVVNRPPPPLTPLPAWLFPDRRIDARTEAATAVVLAGAGGRVDAGQPVVIPFPAGTPPGEYRIRITPTDGRPQPRYLTVSRIAAVREPQRRVLQELPAYE